MTAGCPILKKNSKNIPGVQTIQLINFRVFNFPKNLFQKHLMIMQENKQRHIIIISKCVNIRKNKAAKRVLIISVPIISTLSFVSVEKERLFESVK